MTLYDLVDQLSNVAGDDLVTLSFRVTGMAGEVSVMCEVGESSASWISRFNWLDNLDEPNVLLNWEVSRIVNAAVSHNLQNKRTEAKA